MIQQLPMRIIQLNGQLVRGAKSVVPLDATGARISTVATLVVVVQLRSVAVATTGGTDVTFWLNIFPHLSFWFSYLNSPPWDLSTFFSLPFWSSFSAISHR